jgi:HlyD family secretion protein
MFVIAKSLADMQVETSVDEADVGRLQPGQEANFTVDGFPGKRFKGEVTQVRKAALVVSNVVTYTAVVSAANPDQLLLPGMTANVRVITAQKDSVLKVPNAALRFRPPASGSEEKSALAGRPPGMGQGSKGGKSSADNGKVWTLGADGTPTAIELKTGINDGSQTEVLDDALQEGQQVIVGVVAATDKKSTPPRMF